MPQYHIVNTPCVFLKRCWHSYMICGLILMFVIEIDVLIDMGLDMKKEQVP
jgi:hypothetical protein